MKSRKFWLGILVIVLAFGMMVVGCNDGSTDGSSTDGGTDIALNGTWVASNEDGSEEGSMEIKLNNGNFEQSIDGIPWGKATYTASNGIMIITPTHLYGSNLYGLEYGLDSKWYSQKELEIALKNREEFSDENISEMLNSLFSKQTTNYSVNGNTLIVVEVEYGNISTFTRKK